eukprot:gene32021-41526_t
MKATTYWKIISACGIVLIVTPMIMLASNYSLLRPAFPANSSFQRVLQTSNPVYVIQLSLVLSILPSAVEVVMDIVERKAEYLSSIYTNERFVFCAIVLVLSTVFLAFRSSEFIPLIYIAEYYCRSILLACLGMTAAYSEIAKDSILLYGHCILFTLLVTTLTFHANITFYKHLNGHDLRTVSTLNVLARVTNVCTFSTYLYVGVYRWYRVFTLRQNSYLVRFDRMTIGEKRIILNLVPIIVFNLFRVVYSNFYISRDGDVSYWESQTEFSLMIDLCAQYFFLALVARIFKLELSWRSVDGSLHKKLDWVQILADRSHVTLTISDSTLATSSPGPLDV